MHDSSLNPTKDPNLAGKHRRYALNTQTVRKFSSDRSTERTLVTLKAWLAGKVESADVVSVSLLARRALAVYRDHCAALNVAGNLDRERNVIRNNSKLPNPNPRKPAKKSQRQTPIAAPSPAQ